ncbi:Substance-K receptor [Trichoplax sp. H2]|nr:Substance-K receptor [Trichoplax sp. H2]|eukprot:RDD46319.1 Substance-K receptor [Trichoplax sp. H2]
MNSSFNNTINSTIATTAGGVAAIISPGEQAMRTAFIVITVVYILVMIVAIPGNFLILWITLANKKMRTPTNLLVCNLALAGLLLACIRMPIKTYELIYPTQTLFFYPFSTSVCKMAQIVPASCITSISITLTTICIDRFISVIYPTKRHLRMTLVKVYIFLPASWLLSFLFWTPYGVFVDILHLNGGFKRCVPTWPQNPQLDINITDSHNQSVYYLQFSKMIIWLLFIIFVFLLPAIIMTTLYAIIVRKLWQTGPGDKHTVPPVGTRPTTGGRRDTLTKENHGLKAKRRVVKIFITCLVLFIVTNLPYYLIFVLVDFQLIVIRDFYLIYTVINVLIILNYTCIAYNAIIYGYFNKTFKNNAPKWIRRIARRCNSSRVEPSSYSLNPGSVAPQTRADEVST